MLHNLDKIGGVTCDFRQLVEWGALGSFRHVCRVSLDGSL